MSKSELVVWKSVYQHLRETHDQRCHIYYSPLSYDGMNDIQMLPIFLYQYQETDDDLLRSRLRRL